jgi:hypothetical protein
MRWWMPAIVGTLANHMLSMDEPDHARLRGVVDEAFRRRAILEMESRILALADQLADRLFADGSPADLVARYARWLPLSVICELLGLPLADRPKFTAWASRFTGFTSSLGLLRALPGILAMKRYLQQRLEAARREGGEGLIAELVRAEKEDGRIGRAKNEIGRASGCLVGRAREVPAGGIGPGARCCNNGICEASYSGNGHRRPRSVSALASRQRLRGDVTAQSAAGAACRAPHEWNSPHEFTGNL